MRFDLTTLRLFVAVVAESSISKAARREHIAVSAASRRISDLEHQVGQKLFERAADGVILTAAGRSTLYHAQAVFRSLQDLEAELGDFDQGVRGIVRIAANVVSSVLFLPEDIARFANAYPGIVLDLRELPSPEVVRAVADGSVDLGLSSSTLPMPDLDIAPYRQDRVVLAVPRSHPLAARRSIAFHEALGYPLIGMTSGSALDIAMRTTAQQAHRAARIVVRVSTFDAVARMVQAGVGIGLMPSGIAQMLAAGLALATLALSDDWATQQVVVCTRGRHTLPASARLFVEHLTRPRPAE
ncbi:MAG: LysR substrate-binding domain-containing protein [Lautropia sp.]